MEAGTKRKARTGDDALHVRISSEALALIETAAAAEGLSKSDFVRRSAIQSAEQAILARTVTVLPTDQFQAFLAWLDAPTDIGEDVMKRLQTPPVWQGRDAAGEG